MIAAAQFMVKHAEAGSTKPYGLGGSQTCCRRICQFDSIYLWICFAYPSLAGQTAMHCKEFPPQVLANSIPQNPMVKHYS
jgi:hypothetical protein